MNFNESVKEIIEDMSLVYVSRKHEKDLVKNSLSKVMRMTSVTASHDYENKLAIMLFKLFPQYEYRVEANVTLNNGDTKKPDILVLDGDRVILMLELKLDLGYVKGDWKLQKENIVKTLKDSKWGKIHEMNPTSMLKTERIVTIPNDLAYGTIILAQKNSKKQGKRIINDIKEYRCNNGKKVPYFILMRDSSVHPNDFVFNHEVKKYFNDHEKIKAINSDWSRLEKFLNDVLKKKE